MGVRQRQQIAARSLLAAACLIAVIAQGAAGQKAAAAAGAGGAIAAAGVLPPASLAGQCQSSASVSPWDNGNNFPDVILCCGASINFQWSGTSGVWQIASGACPATFFNSTTARQLLPTTQGSGGVKSLYLPTPGTFYFTSPTPGACSGGLVFRAQVPPGSGTVCPVGAPAGPTVTTTAPAPGPQTSTSPGSMAAAQGPPNGTSTSTSPGAAAAASGPPGTSRTVTAPGMSYSSAGNGRRKLRASRGQEGAKKRSRVIG